MAPYLSVCYQHLLLIASSFSEIILRAYTRKSYPKWSSGTSEDKRNTWKNSFQFFFSKLMNILVWATLKVCHNWRIVRCITIPLGNIFIVSWVNSAKPQSSSLPAHVELIARYLTSSQVWWKFNKMKWREALAAQKPRQWSSENDEIKFNSQLGPFFNPISVAFATFKSLRRCFERSLVDIFQIIGPRIERYLPLWKTLKPVGTYPEFTQK